jgi:hypothetical protein
MILAANDIFTRRFGSGYSLQILAGKQTVFARDKPRKSLCWPAAGFPLLSFPQALLQLRKA